TFQLTRVGEDDSDSLAGGDIDITGPLTIQGVPSGFGPQTDIQGNPNSLVRERLFDVHGTVNVTFSDLILRNAGNVHSPGGAILGPTANVVLTDCLVRDNVASVGGAINAATVTLRDTTLTHNGAAGAGGGVFATTAN